MSDTRKRIINNYVSFLAGDLAAKFLGILAVVYIARKLGADNFGKLGFAESFFGYFIYVGIAGVDTIATRDIARDKKLINDYLGDVLSLKLLLCSLAYLLLVLTVSFLGITEQLKHLTLLYGLCLLPLAISTEWLFQGIEKMKYIGLFRLAREAVYAAAVVLFFFFSANALCIPLIRVSAMLIASGILFFVIHRMSLKVRLRKNIVLWKALMKQSYSVLLSQMLIIVIYSFSITVLGLLDKTEEIGYFGIVQRMIMFFFGLAGVFWAVIFPTLSRLYVNSKYELAAFEGKVSKVVSMAAIPVGFIGFILAGPIITFVCGDDYGKSIRILQVLIWVAVIGMLNGIFVQGLLAANKEKLYLKAVGLQACLIVALAIILVPGLGGLGASISWLASEIVGLFLCKRFCSQVVSFPFYRYLIKPTFAAAVAMLVLNYLGSLNIFVALVSGIMVYFIVMLCIKGVKLRELKSVCQSITLR